MLGFAVLLLAQLDPQARMLTLEQAISIAQERTNEIVRATTDVLLVDVERARALGAVMPSLTIVLGTGGNFGGSPIYEARDPGTTQRLTRYEAEDSYAEGFFRPAISLRQLVYDGGRWWLVISRVSDIEAQRRASLDAVRNDVRLNVVRQFYGLERAQQAVETFQGQIQVSEDQLKRARETRKPGDIATALRNLAEDKVQFARREFAADEARRSLNIALGRSALLPVELIIPGEVSNATVAIPNLRLPAATALIDVAMKVRPELIRSRASLEIIKKNVGIAQADNWPRLTVGAAYRKGWQGSGNRLFEDAFFTPPNENYFITLDATISWNVFDGFRNEADVAEVRIVLKRAISDHEALIRLVAREVDSRTQNLALQMAIYDLARDAAQSAEDAVRLARTLSRQGKATALELRDSEQKFTQSRLQATSARLDVELAIEELRRAVGKPIALE